MIMDKIFKNAEDHNKSLQEKIFSVLPIIGLLSLFLLIFIGHMVGDDPKNSLVLGGCLIVFTVIVSISLKKKMVQVGAVIIGLILLVVMLPLAFIFGGGIYGGSPLWFVFGFAFIGLTVEGRSKYILMIVGFVCTTIAYYIAYKHPEFVVEHTNAAAHFDSLVSVILVSLLLVTMILFENRIYGSETRLIEKQKKEIEELSQTRNSFFSNVSHEIRTPINSIMGFNEIIIRNAENEDIAESAHNIREAGRILLKLVNDVLDVARLESGNMEIVPDEYDVGDMLSDTINMVWDEAVNKGLAFYVDVDPEVPVRLVGDDIRLEQIFINLIKNAIKFTEEGSITVSVKTTRISDHKVNLEFTVEDTGIGIKRDDIPQVFNQFKRINTKDKKLVGTGLGLVIVKQLTEQMHGTVQVNSIYTKGSTFSVIIPQDIAKIDPIGEVSVDQLRKRKERRDYLQSFEAPGAKVLIVDDNRMNRSVMARLLQYTKIQVDEAASGFECLEICANTKYDCIIMDQIMPEMDGTECLRKLRQQIGGMCRDVPVVLVTAFASADDKTKYRMAGFDGYMLKPVTIDMLENMLLRMLPADIIHKTGEMVTDVESVEVSMKHKYKLPLIITSESVCDLPHDMIDRMRIPIIPYSIRNKHGSFIDGLETVSEGVLEYMREGGAFDTYAEEPTVEAYEEFFAASLEKADNIIHISMSGKLGKAYSTAIEAASSFDKVHVIDSESLSSGMGLLVLEAVKYVEAGMDVQTCIQEIDRAKKLIHSSFLINSPDYLIKNGRVNPRMKGLSRVLMMRPAVTFRDGRGGLDRMFFGPTDKIRRKYVKSRFDSSKNINLGQLFITHTGLSISEVDDIKRWVNDEITFKEIIVQKESAATAAMHGDGTFGLLFMYEKDS